MGLKSNRRILGCTLTAARNWNTFVSPETTQEMVCARVFSDSCLSQIEQRGDRLDHSIVLSLYTFRENM